MLKKHTEISLSLPLKGQQLHSSVFCNSKNIKCSVAARSAVDGKFSPFEIMQALISMLLQNSFNFYNKVYCLLFHFYKPWQSFLGNYLLTQSFQFVIFHLRRRFCHWLHVPDRLKFLKHKLLDRVWRDQNRHYRSPEELPPCCFPWLACHGWSLVPKLSLGIRIHKSLTTKFRSSVLKKTLNMFCFSTLPVFCVRKNNNLN